MLIVSLTTTGRYDPSARFDAEHQPKPIALEARLLRTNARPIDLYAEFRPDGWTVPEPHSQITLEKTGLPRLKSTLPLIADFVTLTREILAHGFDDLDKAMRCWRAHCGGNPEWLRPGIRRHCTALIAAPLMGCEWPLYPSIEDATESLCGTRTSGVDGILALYHRPEINRALRAA